MTDMVEKVARAILSGHDWTPDVSHQDDPGGWETLPPDWQDAYRNMAIAALEALREPIASVLAERKAVYAAKASRRDPFAEPDTNRHERDLFAVEVMEWTEAKVAALFDAALAGRKAG